MKASEECEGKQSAMIIHKDMAVKEVNEEFPSSPP